MKKFFLAIIPLLLLAACKESPLSKPVPDTATKAAAELKFEGGYPTDSTVKVAYDEADLNRAVQMYRAFYQTVSGQAIYKGNLKVGVVPNKVFGTLDTKPKHIGFTLNSDTPYGPVILDLHEGPMVIDIPAGMLVGAAMALNQDWIADLGLPGPFGDKGGKFLILPPGYKGAVPQSGYHVSQSPTFIVLGGLRAIPVGGDLPAAIELLKAIKVYPVGKPESWKEVKWLDMTPDPQNTAPIEWENNISYWQELAEVVNNEPALDSYRQYYGELASLGIEKGKPFAPDARMKEILEKAARTGNAQMRVESFSDRRPDRVVWPDRKWEWACLRFEDGAFSTANYTDTYAREKWMFQAIGLSPAMFRRDAGAGSVYWLGLRDKDDAYLNGSNTYKLSIPLPVPAKLFWSVTVYDAETRSQVDTDQGKAALRSLFELKDKTAAGNSIDLYFGPESPAGFENQWIKTIPGKGWFVYFRAYGPDAAAFNGSWKPADFEKVK